MSDPIADLEKVLADATAKQVQIAELTSEANTKMSEAVAVKQQFNKLQG